ncbi:thiolase, partial [Lachnotalea glycerini]
MCGLVPAQGHGAKVLRELRERCKLEDSQINLIIGGNAVGGGGNITRLAALEAGISETVAAVTVDLQCGSALESITMAAAMIESKAAEVVVAGGFESSSTQPIRMWNPNHPDYVENKSYTVAKFMPGIQGEQVMLEGAELTAFEEGVTKDEMDAWILRSHKAASLTAAKGILSDVTVSVNGSVKDEGIRAGMSQRLLDRLPETRPKGKAKTAAKAGKRKEGAANGGQGPT